MFIYDFTTPTNTFFVTAIGLTGVSHEVIIF